jgi:mRNA interferase RelE/StbE
VTDDASSWAIQFEARAERDLRRLDPPVKGRVLDALDRVLARDPSVDLRRLRGSDEWRLRVGDWRVRLRLDFEDRCVIVVRVLPRGRAYER